MPGTQEQRNYGKKNKTYFQGACCDRVEAEIATATHRTNQIVVCIKQEFDYMDKIHI